MTPTITNNANFTLCFEQPTEEDLKEIERAFGKDPTNSEIFVNGYKKGVIQGIASLIGALAGKAIISSITTSSTTSLVNRAVLCKSSIKITENDLLRMQEQIKGTEFAMAEAKQTLDQATKSVNEALINIVDHVGVNVNVPSVSVSVGIEKPGSLIAATWPAYETARAAKQEAAGIYNNYVVKHAQEKATYGRMFRAYEKQTSGGGDTFWDVVVGIFFGIVGVSFKKDF